MVLWLFVGLTCMLQFAEWALAEHELIFWTDIVQALQLVNIYLLVMLNVYAYT